MEEFLAARSSLITIGLAGLLVHAPPDAERFGTAEYYEATRDGEQPRVRRRLAWYGTGAALWRWAIWQRLPDAGHADAPL